MYTADKDFKNIDYSSSDFPKGEYDSCSFLSCSFLNSDLSETSFEECTFKDCDLSNVKLSNTAFKNVRFENCKLIGLQFDECNPFLLSFQFKACQLNLSGFYKLKIKGTYFIDCLLQEVDFTETELSETVFKNCDFTGAMFGNTKLEKADLSTSSNFSIDPEMNSIYKAKFSLHNLPGLLEKHQLQIV